MGISAAFRDALRDTAAIGALVGAHVYRDERPQGEPLPAIVILLVSDPRPLTFSGESSLRPTRFQVDCLATSRGLADEIGDAVILAVDGRALSTTPPFESARIVNVRNDSGRDTPATNFRTAIDVMVWHHS